MGAAGEFGWLCSSPLVSLERGGGGVCPRHQAGSQDAWPGGEAHGPGWVPLQERQPHSCAHAASRLPLREKWLENSLPGLGATSGVGSVKVVKGLSGGISTDSGWCFSSVLVSLT